MATLRRGRTRTPGETGNEQPADNHAEFMVAMANLANTIERLGQPAGNENGNENGNGDGNRNGGGNGNDLGGTPMTLATFLKVYPPTFRGSTNPTEAGNWFQAMEHALQAQHVPYNHYPDQAKIYRKIWTHQEALHWCYRECRLLQLQNADIPCDVFQTTFYNKYFPKSVWELKEFELMQLKQGSLSVVDYTSQFEKLCRFSRVCQGALESYESWKSIKYQGGLKDNIMTVVAPLEIWIFSELVNKARVVEECAKKVAPSRDTHGENNDRGREKHFQPRAQNIKRGGHVPQGQGNTRRRRPTFDLYHPAKGRDDYFDCRLPGHMARDCTREKNPNAGRKQHQ
ncbi:uncharacterized protein LOC130957207 [Arachis stenosperma]|uniref:uncharacterized protein LOC130957207 n=1 Tax=Arachis stenosperma TaxID=217475 RepID=UPI0025ACA7D3|nr:uncharacterized protein LOC130957207 [Arachis stenosperma]